MTPADKVELLRILEGARGDDLFRAQLAFKGSNLDEQWGQSGRTKREILAGYQEHEATIKRLIQEVNRIEVLP